MLSNQASSQSILDLSRAQHRAGSSSVERSVGPYAGAESRTTKSNMFDNVTSNAMTSITSNTKSNTNFVGDKTADSSHRKNYLISEIANLDNEIS
jgi:hypothetical protein